MKKSRVEEFGEGSAPLFGRRAVLRGAAGVAALAVSPAFAAVAAQPDRSLSIRNLHTEEVIRATYWSDGVWQVDGLGEIKRIMRDFRTNEYMDIDIDLLDQLFALTRLVETDAPLEVFSGYRSPRTNALLARQSSGVAKKSYHMQGRAVDLRVPGVKLASLRRAALSLRLGGVGYYPKSGFIHMDSGPVRSW